MNLPKLIARTKRKGLSTHLDFKKKRISFVIQPFSSTRAYCRKISAAETGAVNYVTSLCWSHVDLDLLGEQLVPF